jgi:hypothetical protein
MKFPEETLMAYVDDELDAPTRAAVEAAMRTDPELKRFVFRQQALRLKLRETFDRVLEEPVPERLLETARGASTPTPPAEVTDLAAARTAKTERVRRRWAPPEWSAMAACLVVGLFVGQALFSSRDAGPFESRDGHLVARGTLERALASQLAGNQPNDAPVHVGLSFRDKSGDYCRTFVVRTGEALAGLACHEQGSWRMEVLAQGEAASAAPSGYRMAGTDLPETVFKAVEAQIAGEPFDAEQEAAAQAANWE